MTAASAILPESLAVVSTASDVLCGEVPLQHVFREALRKLPDRLEIKTRISFDLQNSSFVGSLSLQRRCGTDGSALRARLISAASDVFVVNYLLNRCFVELARLVNSSGRRST